MNTLLISSSTTTTLIIPLSMNLQKNVYRFVSFGHRRIRRQSSLPTMVLSTIMYNYQQQQLRCSSSSAVAPVGVIDDDENNNSNITNNDNNVNNNISNIDTTYSALNTTRSNNNNCNVNNQGITHNQLLQTPISSTNECTISPIKYTSTKNIITSSTSTTQQLSSNIPIPTPIVTQTLVVESSKISTNDEITMKSNLGTTTTTTNISSTTTIVDDTNNSTLDVPLHHMTIHDSNAWSSSSLSSSSIHNDPLDTNIIMKNLSPEMIQIPISSMSSFSLQSKSSLSSSSSSSVSSVSVSSVSSVSVSSSSSVDVQKQSLTQQQQYEQGNFESNILNSSSSNSNSNTIKHTTNNTESTILNSYHQLLQYHTNTHFGYPYNLLFNYTEIYNFLQYSINNLGDPYIKSNYNIHSRQFEVAIIDFFATLWNFNTITNMNTIISTPTTTSNNNNNDTTKYWGYITASGTEGNLHGILLARECFPNGIVYTSTETHYSIFKAIRYYRMDCQRIQTLPHGEMDYNHLASLIRKNYNKPVIINVNIGTTVKGAIDNIDQIVQVLQNENISRDRFYIHCDGALFGLMIPFIKNAPQISFTKQPIDSIAVSGHKMLGCPMPCGVVLCRKEHITRLENHIDYLNSIDTTIMGSRNGHAALYLWYALRKKGIDGIQQDVVHSIETAQYLYHRLKQDVHIPCGLNEYSSTVVFERPYNEQFIQKWQLACSDDIAHVVVMPNITRTKIDQFVTELIDIIQTYGRIEPNGPNSSLSQLNQW